MTVRDDSGWKDGQFNAKCYFIMKGEHTLAGPFASSVEVLRAAKKLAAEASE